MEESSVRIGIVGCGGMAHFHARELINIPEAEVVALSDVSTASIARIRERFRPLRSVPVYEDYREMLAKEKLDGVVIVTPHNLHYEQARDALDAGCHVLVEKPFVPSVAQGRQLIQQAEGVGRLLSVGYQRRSMGAYRYMREAIANGRLGRVHFVNMLLSQDWLRGTRGTWRQNPNQSCGGQLNDSGSHIVNALLFLIDDQPVEVYAQTASFDAPVDINAALLVRFRSGVTTTFSLIGHATHWSEQVQVWGDQGTLTFQDGRIFERLLDSTAVWEVVAPGPTVSVDRNFVDAILGRSDLHSPATTAVNVVELTEAAFASAARGAPVKIGQIAEATVAPASAGAVAPAT